MEKLPPKLFSFDAFFEDDPSTKIPSAVLAEEVAGIFQEGEVSSIVMKGIPEVEYLCAEKLNSLVGRFNSLYS